MQYKRIVHGKFTSSPNRFIAHVEIDGKDEAVKAGVEVKMFHCHIREGGFDICD